MRYHYMLEANNVETYAYSDDELPKLISNFEKQKYFRHIWRIDENDSRHDIVLISQQLNGHYIINEIAPDIIKDYFNDLNKKQEDDHGKN